MASDIMGLVSEALGPDVLHKISGSVGESQQDTQKALGAAVPAILAGMAGQAAGGGAGLASLVGLLSSGKINPTLLTNLGSMLHGSSASGLMDTGRTVANAALGSKLSQVENALASTAGVQASSAGSILSIAGPIVMAAIAKLLGGAPSVSGLTNLLASQRSAIMGALPAGLGSVLSGGSIGSAKTTAVAAVPESSGGGMGKILGLVALAVVIIGALLYFMNSSKTVDTAKDAGTPVADASKSAISALGEFFKRKLPNGVELNIPKLGIENRLIDYIEDGSKTPDKETWFDFDRLLFDTGAATLQPASQEQLQNIANILKAYPKVKVRIGGYTDNTGDKALNLKLSADRANNVMGELVKQGIDPVRMDAKGYGEDNPVADNATEEGRAKNRRISLRVTEK
jgi:OOP family OmpA-OmpF porin